MNFKNKVILGPMVAVTNIAFRKLCTDYGADIVYSQMISSNAFVKGNRKLADFYDEKNLVAQFFGNDAKILSECAKSVEDKIQAFDLNLGCPHSDVVKNKSGSYLMKYPKKIADIVKSLVKSVNIPITVKIRAGYDAKNINAVEIAKICEKEGVSAVAVHGRARTINYSAPVDYSIIKEVKEAVSVPVIGNGDIFSGKDAQTMFDKTGCDSVMVGRGAIGKPWLFSEIKNYMKGKADKEVDRKKMFLKFLGYSKKYKVPFKEIKTQTQWFTKGIKHGGEYRLSMNSTESVEELRDIFDCI